MKKNTSDSKNIRRIGLVLATIHAGSSLSVWERMADCAAQKDCAFFVFPGGKLNKQSGSEFLRNQIYSLANSRNLDGLISWSSSISGEVSIPELNEFHKKFSAIPFVTIGQKFDGIPNVEFDAYSGMKKLIEHFIHHHAVRKIAFVRGPENHISSEDRFRAFCDAVRENSTEGVDFRLVSSCCSWFEAEKAAEELVDERGLVPGKDFDALIASSDLMARDVVEFLAKRGFSVPKDYIVGGFNDTLESRILEPQLTTVRMPKTEVGETAFSILWKMLSGTPGSDKLLHSYPIIRESCGCTNLKNWMHGAEFRAKIKNQQHFKEEICKIFQRGSNSDFAMSKIEPLISLLLSGDEELFLQHLEKTLLHYFENEGELSAIFEMVFTFKNATFLSEDFVKRTVQTVSALIPIVQTRSVAKLRHSTMKTNSAMSALKTDLLTVHNIEELLKSLRENLPPLGIKTCSIVFYEDENYSRYIGGFNLEREETALREETVFDSALILPEQYSSDIKKGIFVVQPLFLENHPYGYLVTDRVSQSGGVYEDLRGAVSSALQSIFLFEELESAKIKAEQAEFEKTEFFAAVGSELCDPLKDLSAKVSQIENNINSGFLDGDILSEQMLFLRSQIEAQLEKTETLVDLTRSQVDDLPMDKRLFDIRQILPASASSQVSTDIPMLFGDIARLKNAMERIFEEGAKCLSVKGKISGIQIKLDSSGLDWSKPELLLAEKIILLQYGEILRKEENITEILFPWPNFSGQPPAKFTQGKTVIRSISAKSEDAFGEKSVPISTELLNGEVEDERTIFLWNPDDAPIDEWIKVYAMRRIDKLFRAPVISRSRMLIGHSFLEMLEEKVKSLHGERVLFIGAKRTRYGTWATDSNTISVDSIDNFDRVLAEITPSLIVLEEIDESAILKIRQHSKTVLVPILILPESIKDSDLVEKLCRHPKIILCNRGVANAEQFDNRIHEIISGGEILPPNTGALVKKAILYLNKNASSQIVRWKLADAIHVSEDYLTRIFHKEIGLSLWEYLNRHRICLATRLLLETNDSIYEIAESTGFQDQAYFCRVFKKIYGVPPGKIRQKN